MENRRSFLKLLGLGAAAAAIPASAALPDAPAPKVNPEPRTTGARTEFKDGCRTVYDDQGIARVKMGTF